MVQRRFRSTSVKKVGRKTPGGKVTVHYRSEKPSKHRCGRCGRILMGTPNDIPSEIKKLSKSEKKPGRMYGGNLCASCLERLLRYQTRFEVKYRYPKYRDLPLRRDLTLEKLLPRDWYRNLGELKD